MLILSVKGLSNDYNTMKSSLERKNNGQEAELANLRTPGRLVRLLTVIMTVAVLWAVTHLIFGNKASGVSLYQVYFQPFTNVLKTGDGYDYQKYRHAMDLYESGNYKAAMIKFEEAVIDDPDNTTWQFYYAICQLASGNTEFAIADFQEVMQLNDPTFSDPSAWYLGLAYVKAGQKAKAQKLFKAIASSDLPYKNKAAEILKKL